MVIIACSEDLKEDKYFKRYLKITFLIGFLGLIMELLNWNYFCRFNCTLLTFSPFLTLLTSKLIVDFYKKVLRKEGFQVAWSGLFMDGIWNKNKGKLSHFGNQLYNALYSVVLFILPFIIISSLFLLIKKNVC